MRKILILSTFLIAMYGYGQDQEFYGKVTANSLSNTTEIDTLVVSDKTTGELQRVTYLEFLQKLNDDLDIAGGSSEPWQYVNVPTSGFSYTPDSLLNNSYVHLTDAGNNDAITIILWGEKFREGDSFIVYSDVINPIFSYGFSGGGAWQGYDGTYQQIQGGETERITYLGNNLFFRQKIDSDIKRPDLDDYATWNRLRAWAINVNYGNVDVDENYAQRTLHVTGNLDLRFTTGNGLAVGDWLTIINDGTVPIYTSIDSVGSAIRFVPTGFYKRIPIPVGQSIFLKKLNDNIIFAELRGGDGSGSGGSGIPEAPSDNTYYGRRNGSWEQVAESGINDNKVYVRKNKAWVELDQQIFNGGVHYDQMLIQPSIDWDDTQGILGFQDGFIIQFQDGGFGAGTFFNSPQPIEYIAPQHTFHNNIFHGIDSPSENFSVGHPFIPADFRVDTAGVTMPDSTPAKIDLKGAKAVPSVEWVQNYVTGGSGGVGDNLTVEDVAYISDSLSFFRREKNEGTGYYGAASPTRGDFPERFAPIGGTAIDASLPEVGATGKGAAGDFSFAQGYDLLAQGYASSVRGAYSYGYGNYSTTNGYLSVNRGYFSDSHGVRQSTGINGNYTYQTGVLNDVDCFGCNANGMGLKTFSGQAGLGQSLFGTANLEPSSSLIFGVGNGDVNITGLPENWSVTNRSDAFTVYKSGAIFAPDLTDAMIDVAGDSTLVTKGWILNQGFGGTSPPPSAEVDLAANYPWTGAHTFSVPPEMSASYPLNPTNDDFFITKNYFEEKNLYKTNLLEITTGGTFRISPDAKFTYWDNGVVSGVRPYITASQSINIEDYHNSTMYVDPDSGTNIEIQLNTAGFSNQGWFKIINVGQGTVTYRWDYTGGNTGSLYSPNRAELLRNQVATFVYAGYSGGGHSFVVEHSSGNELGNMLDVEATASFNTNNQGILVKNVNNEWLFGTDYLSANIREDVTGGYVTEDADDMKRIMLLAGATEVRLKDSFMDFDEIIYVTNISGSSVPITLNTAQQTVLWGSNAAAIPQIPNGGTAELELVSDNLWRVTVFDAEGIAASGDPDQTISFDDQTNILTISGNNDTADLSSLAGGSTPTNLGYVPTTRTITSSTGTNTVLPIVGNVSAGLMTPDLLNDLETVINENSGDQDLSIYVRNDTSGSIAGTLTAQGFTLGDFSNLTFSTRAQFFSGSGLMRMNLLDADFIAADNGTERFRIRRSTGVLTSQATNAQISTEGNKALITLDYFNANVPSGSAGEENVQADWNVNDSGSDAFIKNKPPTITEGQASAIILNTAKVGITSTQSNNIITNNAKVSFPEAPIDSQQYARRNGAWTVVSSGGTGDITGVNITAGTGLTGSVNTASGTHVQTLSIPTGAITSSLLADNSVAEVDLLISNTGQNLNFLTYSSVTGGFTWRSLTGGSGIQTTGNNISLSTLSSNWLASSTYTITAGGFYESSMRKWKENIHPFTKSGLELIGSLEIVNYDRIDDGAKKKIGIIIDDAPKEFANEEGTAVDLYKTIFIQAKAIQELEERLEKLEKRVYELEKDKK